MKCIQGYNRDGCIVLASPLTHLATIQTIDRNRAYVRVEMVYCVDDLGGVG